MKSRQLYIHLDRTNGWELSTQQMRDAFIRSMRGENQTQWGIGFAWENFAKGWRAANLQQTIDAASQINSPQNLLPSHVPGLDL